MAHQPDCKTCNDTGVYVLFQTTEPCPDCPLGRKNIPRDYAVDEDGECANCHGRRVVPSFFGLVRCMACIAG